MPIQRGLKLLVLLLFLLTSLQACDALPAGSTPAADSTSTPLANSSVLNAWIQASPGVEMRYEQWKSPGGDEDTVTIARFDLHRLHIHIGYQPDQPLNLSVWIKQTGAVAVINGGYFDANKRAEALVVSDSQNLFSTSYGNIGGLLAVDGQGQTFLRSLAQQPYDPTTDQLQQATESTPMLIINGQRTHFQDTAPASRRRSIVAIDKQGRLLFIVSQASAFTLDEIADQLANSDLALQNALNLDGGASTGLYVKAGNQQVAIDPYTTLPLVITLK